MNDLKIQGITPAVGKIKVGDINVQKIYDGTELVWPISIDPGQVEICNLIWTDTNSSETELTTGGNVPIVDNHQEMWLKQTNNEPAACYWQYDQNESDRGLFYNEYAKPFVKPPTGFRLPDFEDYLSIAVSPCNPNYPNSNTHAAPLPNNYDPSLLTNTDFLGDSGFNSYGYGGASILSSSVTDWTPYINFSTFWTTRQTTTAGARFGFGVTINYPHVSEFQWSISQSTLASLRFVKDA